MIRRQLSPYDRKNGHGILLSSPQEHLRNKTRSEAVAAQDFEGIQQKTKYGQPPHSLITDLVAPTYFMLCVQVSEECSSTLGHVFMFYMLDILT